MTSFEFLDHPADVGFVARGRTLEECFAAAAEALCSFGWVTDSVEPEEEITIHARAESVEDLVFSWLSEILYLTDAEQWVFRRFEVQRVELVRPVASAAQARPEGEAPSGAEPSPAALAAGSSAQPWEITAAARGEKFDETRHESRTYIKAVTYHQLSVRETPSGWEATVYIDV